MSTNPAPHSSGHDNQHHAARKRPWVARAALWLFFGIAAFFLITEHRAHLVAGLSWLPFLLLLACPLMHVFMHGGHGGHGGGKPLDTVGGAGSQTSGAEAPTDPKAGRPHVHGGDQP